MRHLLDVVCNDVGYEKVASLAKKKLAGLKVAPYYGCQIVRPDSGFDDPDEPTTMNRPRRVARSGVRRLPDEDVVLRRARSWERQEDLAMRSRRNLLLDAQQNGAHCIVTICPLCQMNLDVYQGKINARFKTKFDIPVLYFTQLIGVSLGLPPATSGSAGSR
ncbi:MAG: heterodisulfide reductase-related iron-sulfur binding cluster [Desulfomicrobium escambiense]|nr:heterodisulfide reductase-related iron-sulfur binding cluster [Desulfomicrobium escambiense]